MTTPKLEPELQSLVAQAIEGFKRDIAPYKDDVRLELRAASQSPEDLRAAFVAYWQAMGTLTSRLADDAWDVLVCDVRPSEEANVLGWAAKLQLPFELPQHPDDAEVGHVVPVPGAIVIAQIAGPDPCAAIELDPDDPAYDDAIEVVLTKDLAERAEALRSASEDPSVRPLIERWLQRPRFGVFWASHPGIPYESKFTRLFGEPLPAPVQPKTALAVIARLFQSTDSAVYRKNNSCLTFEGDALVEAVLRGHSVNDTTIDLLDWVKDLDGVCKGLRRITLDETRVSKAGVEKLKKLFPKQGLLSPRVKVL